MKKLLPLLLGIAFASGSAQAADLLGVYRDALGYDAQYAAARAARDAGLEKLPQGKAGLMPQINLVADTQWNDVKNKLRVSPTITLGPWLGRLVPERTSYSYNTNSWGVSLAQPLFRWQNWATYKQAGLAAASAETQYALAKQDLIERVTQAYFDVLMAQEDVATAEAQSTAIAEQLAAAKRNFEVGITTITDTHEAQARYDLVSANVIAANNELEVKRQTLAMLIGKEPEALQGLRSGVEITPPQPEDIGQWVGSAEQGNLNVLLGRSNLEIADREIERNRGGHYPTVDLVASHGRQSSGISQFGPGLGGTDSDATIVGLQLNLPIFSGGLTASKTREAVALREKARSDLENVRRRSALGARQAYLGVTSGLAQVKALEQALVSSQSSLDSNKLGYEVGVRVNIDVLNAQQQLYSTRRDLAKARLQTLMAQLKLKSATGSLTEEDIVAINNLLE
ncbi:Type I secretion outer membrane protein, TolC family [Sterolibacterium denitrificans]|uniref:Channel protein TolC n=2 Tax=Sterolibacterium denitrificans TaxID=157592 RepID=A0A656Z7U7_9PROT|nr:TolC family outer membrane protein [Sterolibacterium denitrificans]KYC28921.1 channel protein TolC [Sterolibacterium denitrificans]SMB23347.1 Type I secretion outer membrane protein, TolC family [Sterolibacterium denitrificans]